jgi:fatty-acyl-CoA synthase
MIVSGGENVFPQEVEEVILRLPSVADAAVVGVTDAEFGQRLRAVVVPADGAAPTEDEIREHVRANLARYKVPRDVVFRDELPRNPTGKVLRRVLVDEAGDA